MRRISGSLAIVSLSLALQAQGPAAKNSTSINVTVTEGTSMAVAVSPDGRTLAVDLQGSIWTLPAAGGAAKRLTDVFNDARQPAWSPDGRTIAFFAFRDGGYDLWVIAPDGTNQRKLTSGPYDDREPAWSHDGTRIAFSSDRGDPLRSNYNIWILDVRTGAVQQITSDPGNDVMPSWSPDDTEIAFASERDPQAVWVATVANRAERKVATSTARIDAPSWGPGGRIVYHAIASGQNRLEVDGKPLTGEENAFPFRVSWISPSEFFYTSDGRIRKRSVSGGHASDVQFTATLQVTPARYTKRRRDFDSTAPRPALGIVRPVISPDGTRVAFAAIGDIYVMPIGGKPENLTKDKFLDTEPAWSPDGTRLVYSSDKGGDMLELWVRDMRTGQERQLTNLPAQPMGATWSPDGSRIAFLNVDGMWRRADVSVVDVATGKVTQIHESLFGPGMPTWSPDGTRVAIAMVSSYSSRFREGTNQILTIAADGSKDTTWYAPVPHLSIDSRAGAGPAWSPDGTKMAIIYEGVLAIVPVSAAGEPIGAPRRVTSEMAHSPSWSGDSAHVLYQSMDKLKAINIETGQVRDVPLDLTYTYDIPKSRVVVHASRLVDGKSETPRADVDIVIEGNRIRRIEPHAANLHTGTVIDATNLTVMPGLMEFHSHLQKDTGEAQGRAWLSFGITTVRSPGGTPYEAAEDREVIDAGVRPGPRSITTGYLMEYNRVYYKMGVAVSGPPHLEMELQRAKALRHDLVKSYVRMTDLMQRRMVEFAHENGIPVATHEVYPSTLVGMDHTEHMGATSRRGYSPKHTQGHAYNDVIQLFGNAGTIICPMISNSGTARLFQMMPSMRQDPRFKLYPEWMQKQVASGQTGGQGAGAAGPGAPGKAMMDIMKAGARIVAGTDTPNGFNLHGELMSYVMAGMTPYQALRAATVTPAEALGIDAGSIEVGKLADLVIVDGNPLQDISATVNVRQVIANGRPYTMDELLTGQTSARRAPTQRR